MCKIYMQIDAFYIDIAFHSFNQKWCIVQYLKYSQLKAYADLLLEVWHASMKLGK